MIMANVVKDLEHHLEKIEGITHSNQKNIQTTNPCNII